MRQFSAVDEGCLEDGCSDGEFGPFYDGANGMVQNLEDAEPQVGLVAKVKLLGNLFVTEIPPEVATELLNTPSNETDILAMTAAQLKLAL